MTPIHPLEDARVAKDVSRLGGRRRLDRLQADGAEGGCAGGWGEDGENGEEGGG